MRIRYYSYSCQILLALSVIAGYSCSTPAVMYPCEQSYKEDTTYNRIKLPFDAKVNLHFKKPEYENIIVSQNGKEIVLKRDGDNYYSIDFIPAGTYGIYPQVDGLESFCLEPKDINADSKNDFTVQMARPVQRVEKDSVSRCLGDRDDWFVLQRKYVRGSVKVKVSTPYQKEIRARVIDGGKESTIDINKQILLSSNSQNYYLNVFTDEKCGQYEFIIKYEEECFPKKNEYSIVTVEEMEDNQTGFVLAVGKDEGIVEGMKFVAKDQKNSEAQTCRIDRVFKSRSICVFPKKNFKVYPKNVIYSGFQGD